MARRKMKAKAFARFAHLKSTRLRTVAASLSDARDESTSRPSRKTSRRSPCVSPRRQISRPHQLREAGCQVAFRSASVEPAAQAGCGKGKTASTQPRNTKVDQASRAADLPTASVIS